MEPHPPAAGSLTVLTLADPDAPAQTAPGRYVLAHMPPSAQAVRLAGDALRASGLADGYEEGGSTGAISYSPYVGEQVGQLYHQAVADETAPAGQ